MGRERWNASRMSLESRGNDATEALGPWAACGSRDADNGRCQVMKVEVNFGSVCGEKVVARTQYMFIIPDGREDTEPQLRVDVVAEKSTVVTGG